MSFTTKADTSRMSMSISVLARGLSTPMNPTSLLPLRRGAAIRLSIPCMSSIWYSGESGETSLLRELM